MKLSIVTTLYKSSPYINEFYTRMSKEILKITTDYEIIFVDDGSPDDSLLKAIDLYKKDPKVKIIELSRNFGHHKAIMTGLSHAKGDFVFLIDSDLEEEPELLGEFWSELQNNKDVDVVYGVQDSRKGSWSEQWNGKLFWKLLNYFSDIKIPSNQITARLMKQIYINSLNKYQEYEIFTGGIMYHCGFSQKPYIVNKKSHSKTTYTFRHKINLLINAISSHSAKPLIFIFNIGAFITLFSILFIVKLIFDKLFFNISFEGWTSIVVSIWFFGGLIIFFLGVIGIYLSKIFNETKNRPNTVIKHLYQKIKE